MFVGGDGGARRSSELLLLGGSCEPCLDCWQAAVERKRSNVSGTGSKAIARGRTVSERVVEASLPCACVCLVEAQRSRIVEWRREKAVGSGGHKRRFMPDRRRQTSVEPHANNVKWMLRLLYFMMLHVLLSLEHIIVTLEYYTCQT